MEIQLKTKSGLLSCLLMVCLSLMLVACKPSSNAPKEDKKAEDPNLVKLSVALQEKLRDVP